MPTVFPSHMYVLAPDHLWYLSLQPEGTDRTRIRYGAALAPEVLAAADDADALIAEKKAFLDKVQVEDRHVVEGIFRGRNHLLARLDLSAGWSMRTTSSRAIWRAGCVAHPDTCLAGQGLRGRLFAVTR